MNVVAMVMLTRLAWSGGHKMFYYDSQSFAAATTSVTFDYGTVTYDGVSSVSYTFTAGTKYSFVTMNNYATPSILTSDGTTVSTTISSTSSSDNKAMFYIYE